MRSASRLHRCPHCSSVLGRSDGGPLLPGHLIVCDGCAGLSRFDDAGERVVALDTGDLTVEVRAGVAAEQRKMRDRYAASGGLPPGYVWRTAPLCRPCWTDLVPAETECRVEPLERRRPETCVFCGGVTIAGIYRRMLRPKDEKTILTVDVDERARELVSVIRHWAGQDEAGCATCGGEFYNSDGDPHCRGCRANYPHQRMLLRRRFVQLLEGRRLQKAQGAMRRR